MEVENILSGCRLKNEKHIEDLRFTFISSICDYQLDVSKLISNCDSEIERVKLLKAHFKWNSVDAKSFPYSQKSCEIACELMKKASEALKRQNFQEALRALNISVMFAEGQCLGRAFAKRAAFFVERNEKEAALRDIQLAIENNCSEKLLAGLLVDREKWRIEINRDSSLHNNIHKEILDSQFQFLHLKKPHKNIPHAEDFLNIAFAEKCGRKIVTTKNVDAGTLLISEDLYSSVLSNLFSWDTEHCHFCCRPILGGIPCPDCVFVSYCSENCRQKASKRFHHYESKFLPFFHCNPTTCLVRDALSLRTISTVGSAELYKIFQETASPLHSDSEKMKGFNDEGIYESSSYLPICNLISHVSNFRTTQIMSNVFKCFVYTEFLNDETDFFTQVKYEGQDERFSKSMFKDFISSLLLRHMESIPFNAISISKLKDRENLWRDNSGENNFQDINTISYGMGLYSLLCLCNHSCDPNVIPLRNPNSTKVSVIALRNIYAGEELCICYGPSFRKQNTEDRREFLQSKYNFRCECIACANDWFDIPSGVNDEKEVAKRDSTQVLSQSQKFISNGQFIEALKILRPCLVSLTGKYDDNDPTKFKCTMLCQKLYKLVLIWLFNSHSSCFLSPST